MLYVDFTDAFGSVDHARLHCIMESMGIPRDAIDVIKDLYQEIGRASCRERV